jgi:hypothetical protein
MAIVCRAIEKLECLHEIHINPEVVVQTKTYAFTAASVSCFSDELSKHFTASEPFGMTPLSASKFHY